MRVNTVRIANHSVIALMTRHVTMCQESAPRVHLDILEVSAVSLTFYSVAEVWAKSFKFSAT